MGLLDIAGQAAGSSVPGGSELSSASDAIAPGSSKGVLGSVTSKLGNIFKKPTQTKPLAQKIQERVDYLRSTNTSEEQYQRLLAATNPDVRKGFPKTLWPGGVTPTVVTSGSAQGTTANLAIGGFNFGSPLIIIAIAGLALFMIMKRH